MPSGSTWKASSAIGHRVIVVDEGRPQRECLVAQLQASGFRADGAWDLPSFLSAANSDQPTIVVIKSGTRDASSLIKLSRRLGPMSKVVVFDLSLAREAEIVATAEAGVWGLLLQTEPFERLLEMLRTAEGGHAMCSTEVSALLLRRVYAFSERTNPDAGLDRLTTRELEILELIAQGRTNQQIASQLVLTLQTVKNHVHRLLSKMQVGSRAAAASVYIAKQSERVSQD